MPFLPPCRGLYLGLLLLSGAARAQFDVTNLFRSRVTVDSNYVISYRDQLALRGLGLVKANALSLSDRTVGRQLDYLPNSNFNLGLGFNYGAVGLSGSVNLPFLNDDNARFGRTRAFDLQAVSNGRRLTFQLLYQSYRGYYLRNADQLRISRAAGVFPQRGDLELRAYGVVSHYVFNYRRFSHRAAFNQTERQRRSAGSALLGAHFLWIDFAADSSLVPVETPLSFAAPTALQRGQLRTLGISGGYIHTFVVPENWFFTMALTLDPGVNLGRARTDTLPGELTYVQPFGLATTGRVAAGYNGERSAVTFFLIYRQYVFPYQRSHSVIYSTSNFRLSYVRRVDVSWGKLSRLFGARPQP